MNDNSQAQPAQTGRTPAAQRRRRRRRSHSQAHTRAHNNNHNNNAAHAREDQDKRTSKHSSQHSSKQSGQQSQQQVSQTKEKKKQNKNNQGARRRGNSHAESAQTHSSETKKNTRAGQKPRQTDSGTENNKGAKRRRTARNRKNNAGAPHSRATRNSRGRRRNHKNGTSGKNFRQSPKRSSHNSTMVVRNETSAGGLVMSGLAEAIREDGSIALDRVYVALIGRLDRRGRILWSMPKGHVEDGEDIAATAEREVWEETGIHGEVFADLGTIDYWFVSEGVRIHKTVHHHLLRYVDGDLNDEDPEVTEVAWIPASQLIEHFAYADERKLARIAYELLPQYARQEASEGRSTPR
ncbi:NUDIX domain-containing protein [Corynebacterium sp. sy039]|nr:NUDIX hydrolase [Corynebacterium sp. sy039]QDZ43435.1 NUDIX domain-containing protein [Corynebacterium sp. sy039]